LRSKKRTRIIASGDALKRRRLGAGYNAVRFSRIVGITRAQLSMIELRRSGVSEQTAVEIARALDCGITDLFEIVVPEHEDAGLLARVAGTAKPVAGRPLRVDLGLSSDQFYRRVRALADAGVIIPERGLKNRLILSPADEAVLRQFRAIEQRYQNRGLEWCAERLRYEIATARAAALEARLEQLEGR